MKGKVYTQRQASVTATPASTLLQSRPFAIPAQQRHAADDLEAQRHATAGLRHSFGTVGIQTRSPIIQPKFKLGSVARDRGIGTSRGHQENTTGLPEHLKTGIESLSGMSMDDVTVHTHSSRPAQLHATAYTQGTNIYVGPGEEKHLPHEAWHVVQQRQGRVKPTMQSQGVALNADPGLEREAEVMGVKALRMRSPDHVATGILPHKAMARQGPTTPCADFSGLPGGALRTQAQGALPLPPLYGNRLPPHEATPIQMKMSDLHKTQQSRKEASTDYQTIYTTVGFEIDLLKTAKENPLEGISHAVLAKSTSKYGLLNMSYRLETDASNTLELVTPPYMLKTDEDGVLDTEDLQNTLVDLRGGYINTNDKVQRGTTLKDALGFINANFNIELKYSKLSQATTEGEYGKKSKIDPTHMSHRTNWGRLRTYLGSDENEQQELKVNKGAGFNPQINILTNRKGYQALNAALPSRIEGGVQFHDEEKPEVTKQKNAILGRIRDSLTEPQYAAFINQLSHTLLALEPRRDALRKQQSMQETIFKQRSLRGIKREEFETMSGDASFVKDISGVWLKTDIINFAIKSVQGNGAALKAMGMAVLRATQARQDEGTSAAAYDAGNTGWRARLIRMGRILFLEGQKQSKDHMSSTRKDALAAVRKADENSYSSLTYSLSDTLLGIRHDTFLREDLVEKAAQALKTKNDPDSTLISGFISDPKVLVELRTIGFTGQEKDDDEVRDKIAALIDNWKKEKL